MTVMFYGQMRQGNEKYLLCSCNAFRMFIKYCLLNITSVSFNSFQVIQRYIMYMYKEMVFDSFSHLCFWSETFVLIVPFHHHSHGFKIILLPFSSLDILDLPYSF